MGENEKAARGQAVVLMSGGIDSAACAHFLLNQGIRITGAFVDHRQAAAGAERAAAISMAAHLGVPLECFSVSGSKPFASGELVGRNAFLVFAALFLMQAPPGLIAMGLHAGTPYYDCSPAFAETMTRLVSEHTDGRTVFVAPFVSWNKQDIYDYFRRSALPLNFTYSCESSSVHPCGVCASCRDRRSLGC